MAKVIPTQVEEFAENAFDQVVDTVENVVPTNVFNRYTVAGFVGGVVLFGGAAFVIKKIRDAKAAKALEAGTDAE
jgi:hypothetical protein